MPDSRLYINGRDWFLAGSGITSSATTIVLQSMKYADGTTNVVTADIGSLAYMVLEPGTTRQEIISFTTITQNASGTATLTGVTRGLAPKSPYTTSASYMIAHAGGTTARISNPASFYNDFANKENNETIAQVWTFSASPTVPTGGTGTQAANATDIANAIVGTSGTATNLVAGTTFLSVAAASAPTPISVGDNDGRVPTQGENNALVGSNTAIAVGTGNKYVTQTGLQTQPENYAVDSVGTDTYAITLSPVPTAYAAGFTVKVKFGTANTGAATLNVNTLGAVSITKNGAVALADGDIYAGQVLTLVHDGTNFQIQSLSPVSQVAGTALTGGVNSNADAYHTHANIYGAQDSFVWDISTLVIGAPMTGFSDATVNILSYGAPGSTTEMFNKGLSVATDYGSAFFTTVAPNDSTISGAATGSGLIIIGGDIWTSDDDGTPGNRIQKNGTNVTIVGATLPSTTTTLGHDPTLNYLLVFSTTTAVYRYSGIAGTTITYVDTITLDTAVTISKGFVFDNTNSRYIFLDTTANLVRRFNSAGVTIDTAAYTFADTNVAGLAIIKGRVHIAVIVATDTGTLGNFQVQYIPTTMTR